MPVLTTAQAISSAAFVLLLASLAASAQPTSGQTWETPSRLQQAAQAFAKAAADAQHGQRLSVTAGQVDARLRLPKCEQPLERFHPPGGQRIGATTVGLRCQTPAPWTIYVPVRVELLGEVLALSRPLARNHVIGGDDLTMREVDLSKLHRGHYQVIDEIVGHRLRRSAQADTIITPDLLTVPLLVNRGQRVSIVGGSGTVQVSVSGEALADGAEGDRIRVRNLSSGKVLQARVIAEGTVTTR